MITRALNTSYHVLNHLEWLKTLFIRPFATSNDYLLTATMNNSNGLSTFSATVFTVSSSDFYVSVANILWMLRTHFVVTCWWKMKYIHDFHTICPNIRLEFQFTRDPHQLICSCTWIKCILYNKCCRNVFSIVEGKNILRFLLRTKKNILSKYEKIDWFNCSTFNAPAQWKNSHSISNSNLIFEIRRLLKTF